MNDYYNSVAQKRQLLINARRQELISQLAYHEANDDADSGTLIAQELANLEAEEANFQKLQRRYQQQVNPAPPPPETESEWFAKSAEKMTPVDALQVFSKSKYFPKDAANDPDFVQRYQQGVAEVQRRRTYESR